jgi:hypothetical protein
MSARVEPRRAPRPSAVTIPNAILLLTCTGWAAILVLIAIHRVFLTNDSVSNYAHVWYIADRLWGGHGVPLHMAVIGHGDAYAFPYAFIPWLGAALVRPLFGDWTVTLSIIAGFCATVAAMWWAFPEVRGAWWFAILLVQPMLVEAPLLGQLPFLWAAAMLFAGIAVWRRAPSFWAAALLGLAQATHPAVMMPIVGVLVAARLYWEPRRGALLLVYGASLAIAAPAAAIVFASPTVEDASTRTLLANLLGTVLLRAIVIAAPLVAIGVQRTSLARVPAIILAVMIALNVALVPVRHNAFAWHGLTREPNTSLDGFIASAQFVPGATYRVQAASDAKYTMYNVLRHGGRLDSEFFPESMLRRSWPDAASYGSVLRRRGVQYVVITPSYDAHYRTNEHALLDSLVASPAYADGVSLGASVVIRAPSYSVYRVYALPETDR